VPHFDEDYSRLVTEFTFVARPVREQPRRALPAALPQRVTRSGAVASALALQQTAGNAATSRLLSDVVARDDAQPEQSSGAGGKPLNIEFHAFIPGALGRPFKSFPHATDLKNQAAFDADVASVTTPNSWKPEPTKTESDVKDPGSARKVWFYSTDERSFGGGSHRVGFKGTVNTGDIGALAGKGKIFDHKCDPSHRVQSTDSGYFTSSGETGKLDGPHAKTAPVTGQDEKRSDAGSSSTVETKGAASYAFMPTLSPDIDYDVKFEFVKTATGATVETWIEHNLFPFYEVLVNGTTIWNYSAKDTGPTLTNLNSSAKYHVGPWPF
jgi:hypothetical protein